ncbi:MAG: nucleoside deaminase [Erysipelotrichales bacterium]
MNDKDYMKLALEEAYKAYDLNEVPVGAILVLDDNVISKSHNTNNLNNNALQHAEINVINDACQKLKRKTLEDATLYVTLEPCMMCLGAIKNARIHKVCFGTFDLKEGALISNQFYKDDKKIHWVPNVLKDECKEVLVSFFKKMREE